MLANNLNLRIRSHATLNNRLHNKQVSTYRYIKLNFKALYNRCFQQEQCNLIAMSAVVTGVVYSVHSLTTTTAHKSYVSLNKQHVAKTILISSSVCLIKTSITIKIQSKAVQSKYYGDFGTFSNNRHDAIYLALMIILSSASIHTNITRSHL